MNITVVITTYDRPVEVRRAVRSALGQTHPPDEIIVVEDGSRSGVEQWLRELDRPVRYINPGVNRGLASSRNTGIREAEGEWIAFLDDDDEWMPQRLEAQVNAWRETPEEERPLLGCLQVGIATCGAAGEPVSEYLPVNEGPLKESIIEKGAVTPSSAFLFRREALVEAGGFDEELISGIDHDIWMKLAVDGWHNRAIPRALVKLHPDETTTMLTDTRRRIRGIAQYVDKWSPVWMEWFGARDGRKYADSYFAMVISRLAGEQLGAGRRVEFLVALRAIFDRVGADPGIWISVGITLLRTTGRRLLNRLRRA